MSLSGTNSPLDAAFFDFGGEGHNVCNSAFGADPTGTASSLDAFQAAIDSLPSTGATGSEGGKIIIPPGQYRMSGNLVLGEEHAVLLQGAGCGAGWYAGTQLIFDDGFGVVVTGLGTLAVVLRDIAILSGGPANVVPDVHGVNMLKRAVLENCRVAGFTGNGVNIDASVVDGNNANLFRLFHCMVDQNGGHGVYAANGDANAGSVVGCDLSHNGGWGGWDNSFLGNTWIANHTDGNGLGAYKSSGATNQSVWMGNYVEGGTAGLVQIDAPGMWYGVIGGAHGVVAGTGARLVSAGADSRLDNVRTTPLVPWTAIALAGGFGNAGGGMETAQYQVTATAVCELKGEVIGGTAYMGLLPQHPLATQRFPVATANGMAVLQINTVGEMTIVSGNVGSGHWVSLSGVHFLTV